ncbi:MAG: alpha-L-fucosidase, partial [Planctomycetota bacterium]
SFSCPAWFRDAKFGVWSHWGPQAVPGLGDWYARYMYDETKPHYRHHVRTYGHPSEFGFKDILPLWRAENFDAEALVGFFADNGARYFMGQAAHCDNFDLWNSKHHRWNSVNVGPERDILGEYAAATRNAGLHFGFSEHLAWSYSWFNTNKRSDSTGPRAGVPYDGHDPAFADLYFDDHGDETAAYPVNPSAAFVESWLARLTDAIDQHQPDIFYTDGAIPFGDAGLELMAHFYNSVVHRTGERSGVYTYKNVSGRRAGLDIFTGDFQAGAGVEDLEHGVIGSIIDQPWQCDTSSGPWFWDTRTEYRTPPQLVHLLIDIVSKNGNLLLNYTQRPDGSLDEATHWTAEQVGKWLAINGEAVYGTRPHTRFGEGAAGFDEGEFSVYKPVEFTARDFRFTTKGGVLYAHALGRPSGDWCVTTLANQAVRDVQLLGTDESPRWHVDHDGLHVTPPTPLPGDLAWVLKISV